MKTEFKDFIGIFENFVDSDFCDECVNVFENNMSSVQTRKQRELSFDALSKNNRTLHLPDLNENLDLDFKKKTLDIFIDAYNVYTRKYDVFKNFDPHGIDPIIAKIQRTDPTEGYHSWHCEVDIVDDLNRMMLMILYLNDVEEGGETEFLFQSLRIKPKKGTMIVCPAYYTHVHRGNPPLSGSKYIMNTWVVFEE